MNGEKKEKQYWLDDPKNVMKIVHALVAVCTILVVLDLFYDKHAHFDAENWFGFYGFYGFVCCVGLVLAAKELRRLVMRSEAYYANEEEKEEEEEGDVEARKRGEEGIDE